MSLALVASVEIVTLVSSVNVTVLNSSLITDGAVPSTASSKVSIRLLASLSQSVSTFVLRAVKFESVSSNCPLATASSQKVLWGS
mgnify:CR=1 FL=1